MSNPMSNRFNELTLPGQERHLARRSRRASRASQIAAIPIHPFLKYTPTNSALDITLDFDAAYSPFQQSEFVNSLNETLPKYSDHATYVFIGISFKVPHMDLVNNNTNAARHCIIANVIYQLNKFRRIDSVQVSVTVEKFYWEQLKPVSAVYGLDCDHWTLDVTEKGLETKSVEIGSGLDRRLRSRFLHEM
ncbi:hypothetical protein NHQ30_004614 [Ciborinia camelliae]|nr:hypothetical protein NHQ30_004614 [Ciborinia camelliae]